MTMLKNELGNNLSTYQKELDNLVEIGFLCEERKSKLRFFRVNTNFVLYGELKRIFSKTVLEVDELRSVVRKYDGIDYAFIYKKNVGDEVGGGKRVLVCVVDEGFTKRNALVRELERVCSETYGRYCVQVYPKVAIRERLQSEDEGIVEMVNADKEMIFSHSL